MEEDGGRNERNSAEKTETENRKVNARKGDKNMEGSAGKEMKELKLRVRQLEGQLEGYAKMTSDMWANMRRRMKQIRDDFAYQERLR